MKLIRSKSDGQNTAHNSLAQTKVYHDTLLTNIHQQHWNQKVMPSEIRAAMKKLKVGKAAGLDGTSGEMTRAGGETVVQAMKTVIDNI